MFLTINLGKIPVYRGNSLISDDISKTFSAALDKIRNKYSEEFGKFCEKEAKS
jgi:hypothetical protein